jgi:hypothetical protein
MSSLLIPSILNLFRKEKAVDHGKQPLDAPQFTDINPCGNSNYIFKNPILPYCHIPMKLEIIIYVKEGRKT